MMPLIVLILIGVFWVLVAVPSMISSVWFQSLNPIEQWLLYESGMFVLIVGVLGFMITTAMQGRANFLMILVNGLGVWLLFEFVFDMYQTPFAIDQAGQFIIQPGATLIGCSVDYMMGWFWSCFGIGGPALYYMVYLVTPLAAIIIAVLMFGSNKVLIAIGSG